MCTYKCQLNYFWRNDISQHNVVGLKPQRRCHVGITLILKSKPSPEVLTKCVHELVVALLALHPSVGHGVAAGGVLAERPGSIALAVAAAAVVAAPRGAGWVWGAAAAAAAHLFNHLHLCPQLCRQQQDQHFIFHGLVFFCTHICPNVFHSLSSLAGFFLRNHDFVKHQQCRNLLTSLNVVQLRLWRGVVLRWGWGCFDPSSRLGWGSELRAGLAGTNRLLLNPSLDLTAALRSVRTDTYISQLFLILSNLKIL